MTNTAFHWSSAGGLALERAFCFSVEDWTSIRNPNPRRSICGRQIEVGMLRSNYEISNISGCYKN